MKNLLVLLFVLLSLQLFAQQTASDSARVAKYKLRHTFESYQSGGFNVNSIGGIGFSYRAFATKYGIEVTCLPIVIGGQSVWVSTGLSFMNKFHAGKYNDFYVSYSAHLGYSDDRFSSPDLSLNGGVSVGFESKPSSTIGYKLGIGYGVYNVISKISTLPAGEIGLYYRFPSKSK